MRFNFVILGWNLIVVSCHGVCHVICVAVRVPGQQGGDGNANYEAGKLHFECVVLTSMSRHSLPPG